MTTRKPGSWIKTRGGAPNYCTVGQHFTTGSIWAWREDATPLVLRHIRCAACAEKS